MAVKNPYGKTVSEPYQDNAHMVYTNGSWTWYVLKTYRAQKYEAADPFARWFCLVVSPCCPDGELGDVWVREVQDNAHRVR